MATETVTAGSSTHCSPIDVHKANGHQQEQELFLQAFEKPTQIYRFLRNRHATNPIFLNRALSYMKDRMSRNHKRRATFKVDAILETVTQKIDSSSENFVNVICVGLFDNSCTSDLWWNPGDRIQMEAALYKITKNKRKDSTSDFQEISTFCTNVAYKLHEKDTEYSTFSIPMQSMCPLGDQHTMFKLLFRIKLQSTKTTQDINNEQNNRYKFNNNNNNNNTSPAANVNRMYGCELIIMEKNFGCILAGDYEVALQDLTTTNNIKSFSPKKRTWETLPNNYMPLSAKYDVFNGLPVLRFAIVKTAQQIPTTIPSKEMNKYADFDNKHNNNNNNNNNNNDIIIKQNNNNNQNHNRNKTTALLENCNGEKIQIVYNFLYGNNTHQQTEYTQELICPWCSLNCLRLYALLKHLKLCHGRFNFTYQPTAGNGARIDVTISDAYDGSYAGSPYDLAGSSGCLFPRSCGPVRRTLVTNLLVCRPRRQKSVCLEEFLVLDEDELSNQRPYITGHNRLYHHTETCLPVHPKELDIDSEGESDPLWLRQKTIQMIDEFSDVNEGEKELMKLWNLHVMKHGYVGDCQLPLACDMFLELNGNEIIRRNLYRNFILHMCSLFDYGLVSPETVYKTVQKLQTMLSKYPEGQQLMSQQRALQLKYWLQVGLSKQDDQKQKSPQKQTVNKVENDSKNLKAMLPPMKRSTPAIKTAMVLPQNSAVDEKERKQEVAKSVAKKTGINIAELEMEGAGDVEVDEVLVESTAAAQQSEFEEKKRGGDFKTYALNTRRRSIVASDQQERNTKNESETNKGAPVNKRRLLSRENMAPTAKKLRTTNETRRHSLPNNNSNTTMNGKTKIQLKTSTQLLTRSKTDMPTTLSLRSRPSCTTATVNGKVTTINKRRDK